MLSSLPSGETFGSAFLGLFPTFGASVTDSSETFLFTWRVRWVFSPGGFFALLGRWTGVLLLGVGGGTSAFSWHVLRQRKRFGRDQS